LHCANRRKRIEGPPRDAYAAWRSAVRTVRGFSPIFALLIIYEILHLLTPVLRSCR
jgi:hypothetical protein